MNFVLPEYIYHLNTTESAIFTQNLEMVFCSFIKFLKAVKSSGSKNSSQIIEWIQQTDMSGCSTITWLLSWVIYYEKFQEEFCIISFVQKLNSFLNCFSFLNSGMTKFFEELSDVSKWSRIGNNQQNRTVDY